MCLSGKNSVSLKDKANCIGLVDEGKSLLRMLAFRTELAENTKLIETPLCPLCPLCPLWLFFNFFNPFNPRNPWFLCVFGR